MDPKQKASIARIQVGGERGTAFLVSRDGLLLTALHCVAFSDSFASGKIDFRAGTINVRFGDPNEVAVGPRGHDGKLFETTATVLDHSAAHDVALLECKKAPEVEPLVLAPSPFGVARWSTFGFPTASGALAADPQDVNGQACDGRVTSMSSRIQLTLSQMGTMDLRGISGAPVIVGGVVVGVALQTLTEGNAVIQNSLFGVHVESFASLLKKLPWQARPVAGQAHLRAALSVLQPAQLVLAAHHLGLSEETEGLGERTTIGLLTCPLVDALKAITDHLGIFLPVPPPREVLALILCSSRIPTHVAETAAPALGPKTPPGKSVRVGAGEVATARSLAFRFALEARGLGKVLHAIADLGPLPGAEDAEVAAKDTFKRELMRLMVCEPHQFESTKKRWEQLGNDVYVLAEVGFPPNLATLLKEVYPRVRVIMRSPPKSEHEEDPPADVVTIPECVPPELEHAFELTLSELR